LEAAYTFIKQVQSRDHFMAVRRRPVYGLLGDAIPV
jgi:hypothetical protein